MILLPSMSPNPISLLKASFTSRYTKSIGLPALS